MNATFRTDAGTTFEVATEPDGLPDEGRYIVRLVALRDRDTIVTVLKKSEARAIASALMGAAAELS
jgi:hypothetical protein